MLSKGLKQVETLLAELCLPNYTGSCQAGLLDRLIRSDAALAEFIRLQDNFEYNGMQMG